jgi:YggT family protein
VDPLITGLQQAIDVLRKAFFIAAALLFVVFLVDWLVRTRRINPFNPVARFFRRSVEPVIQPIERQVVRRGRLPSEAPWWALVVVVVGGILILVLLQAMVGYVAQARSAAGAGPRGMIALIVSWAFGILQIALLVRVILSWIRVSEFRWWVRWAVTLTEPILRPLRRVIPPLGMFDLTPLIAWFAIGIVQGIVVRAIAG